MVDKDWHEGHDVQGEASILGGVKHCPSGEQRNPGRESSEVRAMQVVVVIIVTILNDNGNTRQCAQYHYIPGQELPGWFGGGVQCQALQEETLYPRKPAPLHLVQQLLQADISVI